MELLDVTVRLAGSIQHTVPKAKVTPAEILILRHIHGADAVVDIRPNGKDKARTSAAEWDRLATNYDAAATMPSPGEQRVSLMERLFPGAQRKLPATLKDIGMSFSPEPAPVAVPEKEDEDAEAA